MCGAKEPQKQIIETTKKYTYKIKTYVKEENYNQKYE